jgi:hypothetical protein
MARLARRLDDDAIEIGLGEPIEGSRPDRRFHSIGEVIENIHERKPPDAARRPSPGRSRGS